MNRTRHVDLLICSDGRKYTNDASISRFIVRNSDMFANLLGNDLLEQAQVNNKYMSSICLVVWF